MAAAVANHGLLTGLPILNPRGAKRHSHRSGGAALDRFTHPLRGDGR